jgi:hypothetical protein
MRLRLLVIAMLLCGPGCSSKSGGEKTPARRDAGVRARADTATAPAPPVPPPPARVDAGPGADRGPDIEVPDVVEE